MSAEAMERLYQLCAERDPDDCDDDHADLEDEPDTIVRGEP